MTITNTTNKNLNVIDPGTEVDTWGPPINENSSIVDACLGNVVTINITAQATYSLTDTEYQAAAIYIGGVLNSGNVVVKLPAGVSGQFTFINATTQTDSTSNLQIGWSSGGNTISIAQNTTQILTGDGATPYWYRASPGFSGVSTAITTISLTSLSTYTLTSVDTNSQIIKFTGTLANSTVTVKLPDTSSGQWTFINATTASGTSSKLNLGWVTSSNTFTLNQPTPTPGTSLSPTVQIVYADSSGPTWSSSAQMVCGDVLYYDVTGLASGNVTVTEAQARYKTWYIYGTLVDNYVILRFPQNAAGTYTIINKWAAAGGNSLLIPSVANATSTSAPYFSPSSTAMYAYYTISANNWAWLEISTPKSA